jgi:putative aldouronate transport system substrate-binding protein
MLGSMKKVLKICLCFILLITLLSGCGKDKKSKETTLEQSQEDKMPITFTYWSADTTAGQMDDSYKSPVSQKIKELTGVTLEKEFAIGDPREKLSFMAASGEYPDFIYALEYSNIIVDAGGFVKLDDLIEKHGPNIKKLYGDDLTRLRYSIDDPSIYFLGLPTVDEIRYEPETGFQIQYAVLKELGFPKMETLQDYEEAIKTYISKYPEIEGKPTIGLSLLADDWRIKISVTNPAVFATGGPDDGEWYYDTKTKKAQIHLTRDDEKEYFRWLNHMNDIGLLDPESFFQKYDQYQAKIAEGRVLALADAKWEYVDAEQALVSAGKPERGYGEFPLVLNDSYTYADFRPVGYTGGYGVGISTSCKDPVAAIKFLDWMCSDEGQILARWGIEGEHYDVVDGKRKFNDETFKSWSQDVDFATRTGIGIYSWPWPGYGQGAVDSNGDYYSPVYKQSIIDTYTEPEKETLAAYGAETWKDLYPSEENFEESPYGVLWQINIPSDNEATVIMQKYDEVTAKRIPAAVLAKPEDFDALWEEYQAELKSIGIEKLEDEFNKLIQGKIDLWNKN